MIKSNHLQASIRL